MNKVIYMDVETSGTDPDRHAVVQIAWITEIAGVVQSEKSLLVRPFDGAEIDTAAMEVHGITMSQLLESGVSQTEAVRQITADWSTVIDKYDRRDKAALCAYNLRFDFEFLKAMFERTGDKYLGSWIQFGRWLDPLYLAAFAQHIGVMPVTENLRLETVARELGVFSGEAHDALDDIRMTRAVTTAITNELLRADEEQLAYYQDSEKVCSDQYDQLKGDYIELVAATESLLKLAVNMVPKSTLEIQGEKIIRVEKAIRKARDAYA